MFAIQAKIYNRRKVRSRELKYLPIYLNSQQVWIWILRMMKWSKFGTAMLKIQMTTMKLQTTMRCNSSTKKDNNNLIYGVNYRGKNYLNLKHDSKLLASLLQVKKMTLSQRSSSTSKPTKLSPNNGNAKWQTHGSGIRTWSFNYSSFNYICCRKNIQRFNNTWKTRGQNNEHSLRSPTDWSFSSKPQSLELTSLRWCKNKEGTLHNWNDGLDQLVVFSGVLIDVRL